MSSDPDRAPTRDLLMTEKQIATGKPEVIAVTSQITLYLAPSLHKRWLKAAKYRETTPTIVAVDGLRVAIKQAETDKRAEKARERAENERKKGLVS